MLAVRSVLLPLPGRGLEDVVDSEDHLGGLGGLDHHLSLHAVALSDTELYHVTNTALI